MILFSSARWACRNARFPVLLVIAMILTATDWVRAQDAPTEAAPEAAANERAELQFAFREQPWLDVLDWFARQADLSLVVNEAPPGSFTYSDTRSYTPTEALDLLNGVLSTRGFALIRRDRMLVCAKLADGLPEGLIPRIDLDQLDEFGQFELVEVMFPLGRRAVEPVANEITPLLGPHGKATSLPQTKQLLVLTTAGKMRAINAIIASIPEPDPPKREEPKPEPPAPTLVVYPAKDVDAHAAVEMLKSMLGDTKMTIDGRTGQINAYATPPQHEVIAKLLDQMATTSDEQLRPQLQVHEIQHDSPEILLQQLRLVVPSATLTLERDANRLIAFASPPDQQLLRDTMQTLQADAPHQLPPVPVIYTLHQLQPDTVLTMVQTMFPRARVSIDANTRRLVVLASLPQQTAIGQFLEQLESRPTESAQLRVFAVTPTQKSRFTALQATIDPRLKSVRVVDDTRPRELVVWATAEQLQIVESLLSELKDAGTEEAMQLVAYPIESGDPSSVQGVLSEVYPDVKIMADDESRRVTVWTTPEQHQAIAQAIRQLDAPATAGKRRMVYYRFEEINAEEVVQLLNNVAPEMSMVTDQNSNSIIAWGTDQEHALLAKTVEDFRQQATTEQHTVVRYPSGTLSPERTRRLLSELTPDARSVADPTNRAIVVWAKAEDHATIAEALKQMTQADDMSDASVKSYTLSRVTAGEIVPLLQEIAPLAQFNSVDGGRQLLVWASAPSQRLLQQSIEQIEAGLDESADQVVRVYPLGKTAPTVVIPLLGASLVEGMSVIPDSTRNALIVRGPADRQAALGEAINSLLDSLPSVRERVSHVYRLQHAKPESLRAALASLVPTATVSVDENTRSLIAFAYAEDHQLIEATARQLDQLETGQRETRAYALQTMDVRAARDAIQALLPDATLAADRDNQTLLVTARPAEQQQVAQIVQQITQGQNTGRLTQVYRLQHGDVDAARDALQELLPEAVIASDSANRALLVTASEDGQARVAQVVTQLDQPSADEPQMQAYSVALANVQSVADSLARMYENHQQVAISIDATNRSVLVKAPAVEQRTIAQIISRMENGASLVQQRMLIAYPTDATDREAIMRTFQTLLTDQQPPVDLSLNEQTGQLIAVATPAQHAIIAEAARQMQREPHSVEVFPLQTNDPFAIEMAIDRLYENETAKPIANGDSEMQQLFVRGTRKQLDEVRQLLVKMGELPAPEGNSQRGVRVIPFRGDAEDAVRELQRIWPQLRVNPMQIVRPVGTEPVSRPPAPKVESIEPATGATRGAKPLATPAAADATDAATTARDTGTMLTGQTSADDAPAATEPSNTDAQQPSEELADDQSTSPPIVLIPGSGSITILSEDEGALAQAEALLRSLARQHQLDAGAGNFAIYSLRNAGARNVTRLMTDLFEQMPLTTRATVGRVSMVADERLNAVVVHGRPADRAVIAELLQVLDSSNVPDSLANPRPEIFSVRYLEATQMLEILQGVYQTQLRSGGTGPEIDIPEGVSSEVASLLRQMNAAATGPLLTLEVDAVANSIIVLAPRDLTRDVGALIEQLDRNAQQHDSRDLRIVSLRETNVEQLQEALDRLIRPRAGRR